MFTKAAEIQEEQHNDASMFIKSFSGCAQSFLCSGTRLNRGGITRLMRGELRLHQFALSLHPLGAWSPDSSMTSSHELSRFKAETGRSAML